MIIEAKTSYSYMNAGKRTFLNPEVMDRFEPFDPFTDVSKPGGVFPVEVLCEPYRSFVKAAAKSYQTDIAMPGCVELGVLSIILPHGGFRVRVYDDWTEPVNLFFEIVHPPSGNKSQILNVGTRPMLNAVKGWNVENAAVIEANRQEIEILKSRLENVKKTIAKSKKAADGPELQSVIEELNNAERGQLQAQRWTTGHATPEALEILAAANGGCIAIVSGESGILDILNGTYSKNGASTCFDILLSGYSAETFESDRVTRNSVLLDSVTISTLLMGQPESHARFMSNRLFDGKGLTARFLYSFPQSNVGTRTYQKEAIPEDIAAARNSKIRSLTRNMIDWKQENPVITLSADADHAFGEFYNSFEKLLPDMSEPLQEWAGKLRGNVIRLAGILHLAETDGVPGVISGETMRGAINLGGYFYQQAEYAFSANADPKPVQDARYILDRLTSQYFKDQFFIDDKKVFMMLTRKQLFDRSARFKTVEQMQEGLNELERRGYIIQEEFRNGTAGRPKQMILVRPDLFNDPQ